MRTSKTGSCSRLSLFVLVGLLLSATAPVHAAQKPSISASIQPAVVQVGQQAVYSVTIEGEGSLEMPRDLQAPDALEFGSPRHSRQVNFNNGVVSKKASLSYPVFPTEPGEFEIPGQVVNVGGERQTTNAVRLTVKPASTGGGTGSGGVHSQNDIGAGQGNAVQASIAEPFLRLEVGKTRFYVGEIVPVTLTLFTHETTPLRNIGMPQMERSDFVLREFPRQPVMQVAEMAGGTWRTSSFSSFLSGIRAGEFALGPAQIECLVQIPDRRFGLHPFLNLGRTVRVGAQSEQLALTVLALPSEGKPPDFGGLVGEFELFAKATPVRLVEGDPVSVTLTLRGRGNFDEVTPPVMDADPDGWKTYEPSILTEPEGDANSDRSITFNQVLIPDHRKNQVPSFTVPYFNPAKGEYVVLRSEPIEIEVVAAAADTPPRAETASRVPLGDADVTAMKPTATVTEIVDYGGGGLAVAGPVVALPPHQRPVFLAVQGAAMLVLSLLVADVLRRALAGICASAGWSKSGNSPARKISMLRSFQGERSEFLRLAAELAGKLDAQGQDECLREIVAAHEVLKFGRDVDTERQVPVTDEERDRVVEALLRVADGRAGFEEGRS
jgi:hypothetical protein